MSIDIAIALIVILLLIIRSFSKRKVSLPEFKEQFTIAEEDKKAFIQELFPTIIIPENEFPALINKLDSLKYVIGITKDKIKEHLKQMLLDYLIPNFYVIRFKNLEKSNEQLLGRKKNYEYIFRENCISVSRTEAKKRFEMSKQYVFTQLMIGPKNRKMEYEIQLVYVETKNGEIIKEVVEDTLNEWSLSY